MPVDTWMIYGANGFTGELIAREAGKRNLTPILAGRNKEAIPALARELGLNFKVFNLDVPSYIIDVLREIDLVLHCAGPFSQTSAPMVDACLASKTHYLDITGEIAVFEAIRKKNVVAQQRGVMLMPGVGFGVVPTDCLALNLKKYLPDATSLTLAFDSQGKPSRGSAKTMIEGVQVGCKIRENGIIKTIPFGSRIREIPFMLETKLAAAIPWGDVCTAYYTTGIPNIKVYRAFKKPHIRNLKLLKWLKPLLGLRSVQNFLTNRFSAKATGPDAGQRANTKSYIWGEVKDARRRSKQGHLITPNGYDLTVQTALGIVGYFCKFEPIRGVQTPAQVMGEHFIRTLPGVEFRPV